DHQAPCATCHERNDYSRYSCYGCHEHNPEKIRREHIEEGIRDFRNCVECHRTANKDDIRGKGQEGGKDHERKKKHDDD
ncbi:MAG TPA: class III cytochrome C family protein, partial [Chromatiaceae bacterium]|nr:class III cytochrome C family protein [Chromatiaceae bacterium]